MMNDENADYENTFLRVVSLGVDSVSRKRGGRRELFLVFDPHLSFSTVVFVPVGASPFEASGCRCKIEFFWENNQMR
jgi:hypothetical protein